jgi:hypothetical protein
LFSILSSTKTIQHRWLWLHGTIYAAGKLHNRALLEALKELKKSQLKGYTYSIFDAYTAATAIFNNPSKYGEASS